MYEYKFKKMSKKQIFAAWERFLKEEQTREFSPCRNFCTESCSEYIDTYRAFKLFVRDVMGQWVGTKEEYCKIYNVSPETFEKKVTEKMTVFFKDYLGGKTYITKNAAEIFKFKDVYNNMNFCEIILNEED